MSRNPEMKVSVSVTDSPVFVSLDDIFAGLKDVGVDGVEIVPGVKSRWGFEKLKKLSDKHALPITSVHQPPWSVGGLWFDEGFIIAALNIGINTFVFHPPARCSFADKKMLNFLLRLENLQSKHEVNILLENMPWAVRPPLLRKMLPFHSDTTEPLQVAKAVRDFGLGMTFDTSHAFVANPQNQEWFPKIYPVIRNIHLSSFAGNKDHLPLDMGAFQTTEFMGELKSRGYKGLLTLEVYYPKKISLRDYDFDGIKRSVQIIKKINYKMHTLDVC